MEAFQYDDAIDKLKEIPPTAPEYKEAQKLIPIAQRKFTEKTEARLLDARRSFAKEAEQHMLEQNFDMYVKVSGPKDTIITFRYVLMSRPTVYQVINDSGFMGRLRALGFKKAVFTDGYYSTWNQPL